MLFSLTNLKRRAVRDPDGNQAVVPKLLHGRAALKLLDQAIDLFDSYAGRPRSEYDTRALEGVMGDYRLGRCIEACLLTRYSFVQPRIEDTLSADQLAALEAHGLATPSGIRFAVWDAANTHHGGFVPPDERAGFLSALATEWGLPADSALIESLITLDSEARAVLTLTGVRPTPQDILRQYNRGAVQTLLAHSTRVELYASHLPGAALKRLYFVAKRRGVLVDIEQNSSGGFTILLYGPERAFGTAEKYGLQLADATLSLLRALSTMPEAQGSTVRAVAYLTLHDRPYLFYIGEEIMERLEYAPKDAVPGRVAESAAVYSVGSAVAEAEEDAPAEPSFDSMVEARLYKEYRSLEKQGYTHGWAMQREPEPVLAPGIVLIPDFAFVRGGMRVFMEIAGFWSPTYRERKVAKLRALAAHEESTPLILAVPNDALSTFADLPFPVVPYKNKVAATDLLTLLDSQYGEREERSAAAQFRLSGLQQAARMRGFVPEAEIAAALQAYTRSELLTHARTLDSDAARYVPGVGLLSPRILEGARAALDSALAAAPGGRLDLGDAAGVAAAALGAPQVDLESLLQLWSDLEIERPSLFESYLRPVVRQPAE